MICKATYGVLVGVLVAANFEVSNDKLEVGGIDDTKGVEVAVAVLILLGGLDSSEILVISVLLSSDSSSFSETFMTFSGCTRCASVGF